MAVRISHPTFVAYRPNLALVTLNPEPTIWERGRDTHPPVLLPMLQWLSDDDRAGEFAYLCDLDRKQATHPHIGQWVDIEYVKTAKFYFSNHDTAFEFKMRWG